MSWEQRNADFCKGLTDAQMAYIEAEREVVKLQAENEKLRERLAELYEDQCDECDRWKYRDSLRELGVKVDDG